MADEQNTQDNEQQFVIQRVFVKDLSYEAPSVPGIFQEDWKPEMALDLNTSSEKISDNIYEVVLSVTVTVKNEEKVAFLVEVKQAGIFTLEGFPEDQENYFLGSMCPQILYPYAREVVTDIVSRGSFPQLLLAPVNFDALFTQHMQQQAQAQEESEAGETSH